MTEALIFLAGVSLFLMLLLRDAGDTDGRE